MQHDLGKVTKSLYWHGSVHLMKMPDGRPNFSTGAVPESVRRDSDVNTCVLAGMQREQQARESAS